MGGLGSAGAIVALLTVVCATACTSPDPAPPESPRSAEASPSAPSATPSGTPSATAAPPPRRVRPADLDAEVAVRTVQHLAATIGPRHATSPAYRRAARWVTRELTARGYDVRRQTFDVPGGDSWGVLVGAGTSQNIIATPPGFDPEEPHLVVGAHLDTVPQAPGAEDNASGVGVVLAVAEAVQERRTRLPVMFVAFGAEEPRGGTDADHHYGSRALVAALSPAERRAVRGMLSLDRVGVGTVVPVCAAIGEDPGPREEALGAARRAQVPVQSCENSSSDHWSFVRRGMPGVRLGGTSYGGYHSAADVPAVISRPQLERVGRLVLAWLAGPRSR